MLVQSECRTGVCSLRRLRSRRDWAARLDLAVAVCISSLMSVWSMMSQRLSRRRRYPPHQAASADGLEAWQCRRARRKSRCRGAVGSVGACFSSIGLFFFFRSLFPLSSNGLAPATKTRYISTAKWVVINWMTRLQESRTLPRRTLQRRWNLPHAAQRRSQGLLGGGALQLYTTLPTLPTLH